MTFADISFKLYPDEPLNFKNLLPIVLFKTINMHVKMNKIISAYLVVAYLSARLIAQSNCARDWIKTVVFR
ncbi:hypothetical protein DP179_03810 [Enterobacter roggenkampii]|nr:hypothetical protein LI67_015325 [Enterobacter roggenkampii]KJN74220.1 hypothetical protein SS32_06415 [Enterobacter roggenkampii]RAY78565.1 hypothetical protein DP179_03810 [Enterobacter roggenkampii]RWT63841.1 hypothetical protein DN588_05080 [Enterobacter cloacae]